MKTLFIFSLFIASLYTTQAAEWTSLIGASNSGGKSIAFSPSGSMYVLGTFSNTAKFGLSMLTSVGYRDIFLAKYSSVGSLVWVKQIGSSLVDNGNTIKIGSNGTIYMYGQFQGTITLGSTTLTSFGGTDVFVAALDTSGNFTWAQSGGSIGNDFCYFQGLAIDKDNNLFIVGNIGAITSATFGTTTIPGSPHGIFIVKYNQSGTLLWANSSSSTRAVSVLAVACDKTGNINLTGGYNGSITFGTNVLTSIDTTNGDIFVTKYAPNGNIVWAKSAGGLGTTFENVGTAISCDNDNNIYVGGEGGGNITCGTITSSGGTGNMRTELFLAKLDSNGAAKWIKRAGSNKSADIYLLSKDIVNDAAGNIYWTGQYFDTLDFYSNSIKVVSKNSRNIFVAKYDVNGNALWALDGGGKATEEPSGLCLDNAANVFVTGNYDNADSITTFGSYNFTADHKNNENLFLVKIASTTGIETPKAYRVVPIIYPNPAQNELRITGIYAGTKIKLYNIFGQEICTKQSDSNTETIIITSYDPGVYTIVIDNPDNNSYSYKIVKH